MVADQISNLTTLVNSLGGLFDAVFALYPKVVTCCAFIAAFLPPPASKGRLAKLHRTINILAYNFGHAENKK